MKIDAKLKSGKSQTFNLKAGATEKQAKEFEKILRRDDQIWNTRITN